jgi:hypothetical protein
LYKVAKAEGAIEGKLKEEIRNLQQGAGTVSDRYAIAARTIYLFCGMVANAKDISTEKKFQLFQAMQASLKEESPPKSSQPPTSPLRSDEGSKPVKAPQLQDARKRTEPNSSEHATKVAAFIRDQSFCRDIRVFSRIVDNTYNEFIRHFRDVQAKPVGAYRVSVLTRNRSLVTGLNEAVRTRDDLLFDEEIDLDLQQLNESSITLEPFPYPMAKNSGGTVEVSTISGESIRVKRWPLEYFTETLGAEQRLAKLATADMAKLYRRAGGPQVSQSKKFNFIVCGSQESQEVASILRKAIIAAKSGK